MKLSPARIAQATAFLAAFAYPIAQVGADLRPTETMILVAKGKATHYSAGVMQVVLHNRIRWKHITPQQLTRPHLGYVALREAKYLGSQVWLVINDETWHGPFLVVDCAALNDYPHLDKIGFAIDLSYELALKYNTVGKPIQNVQVWTPYAPPDTIPERSGAEE